MVKKRGRHGDEALTGDLTEAPQLRNQRPNRNPTLIVPEGLPNEALCGGLRGRSFFWGESEANETKKRALRVGGPGCLSARTDPPPRNFSPRSKAPPSCVCRRA